MPPTMMPIRQISIGSMSVNAPTVAETSVVEIGDLVEHPSRAPVSHRPRSSGRPSGASCCRAGARARRADRLLCVAHCGGDDFVAGRLCDDARASRMPTPDRVARRGSARTARAQPCGSPRRPPGRELECVPLRLAPPDRAHFGTGRRRRRLITKMGKNFQQSETEMRIRVGRGSVPPRSEQIALNCGR